MEGIKFEVRFQSRIEAIMEQYAQMLDALADPNKHVVYWGCYLIEEIGRLNQLIYIGLADGFLSDEEHAFYHSMVMNMMSEAQEIMTWGRTF